MRSAGLPKQHGRGMLPVGWLLPPGTGFGGAWWMWYTPPVFRRAHC